jgi:hypothetical protein
MAHEEMTTASLVTNKSTQMYAARHQHRTNGDLPVTVDDFGELRIDDPHAGAMRSTQNAPGAQPRVNFPLPRELRDQ